MNHKFGTKLHKTVEQALTLGVKNDITFYADVVTEEIENVRVVFKILPDGIKALIGHQFVQYHMVYDIKMKDIKCKAKLVAGGHMTKAATTIT